MFLKNAYCDFRSFISYIKYRKLTNYNESLKNSEFGNSCFIIGSGPSLLKHDVSKIQGTSVITINNLYNYNHGILDGINKKNKTYHVVAPIHPPQNDNIWISWLQDIDKVLPMDTSLFMGLNVYNSNAFELSKNNNIFSKRNINWYYSGFSFNPEKIKRNAFDFSRMIYKAEAGSLYALMLADYLGFKDVYLLGMDHDYFLYDDEKDMRVYSSSKHEGDGIAAQFKNDFYIEELFRQYNIFLKYKAIRDSSMCNIYNCTEGGILKVFNRITFLDALEKININFN
ncbi:hypothetical protein [Edwardsiella tarda]|uniref:hypothetical protein n=1 Tax=Edwardsiella tarda TaxID=636 RepID=UPI00351C56F3